MSPVTSAAFAGANQFASSAARDSCGPPVMRRELHDARAVAGSRSAPNAWERRVRCRRESGRAPADQRIATEEAQHPRATGSTRHRVERAAGSPAPHSHSADTRRFPARSRAVLNAAPCSHISISVQSRRNSPASRLRHRRTDFGIRATAPDRRCARAAAGNPLRKNAALAAVVQQVLADRRRARIPRSQLARSRLIEAQQPAIERAARDRVALPDAPASPATSIRASRPSTQSVRADRRERQCAEIWRPVRASSHARQSPMRSAKPANRSSHSRSGSSRAGGTAAPAPPPPADRGRRGSA